MKPLTLAFAGTPAFGLPCLEAIHASNHHLTAIFTQPDRPAGRGRKLQSSAIKQWGEAHGLPVYQPASFKELSAQEHLQALNVDLLIVIAYGLILPSAVLAIPRLGCINVHASLLPRWRGASPIQQAILHGDTETGVTIMQLDRGMDTGAILTTRSTPIHPKDTAEHLHDTLAQLAPKPLLETLTALSEQRAVWTPQNPMQATHAPKITKEDARIHWHEKASLIDQKIRAFNPWPVAYTLVNDTPIRVHQARLQLDTSSTALPGTIINIDADGIHVATGHGSLCLEVIQFPGSKAMPVVDWLHAGRRQLDVGVCFS
jgi:methionyl-tRNA formyltransferase